MGSVLHAVIVGALPSTAQPTLQQFGNRLGCSSSETWLHRIRRESVVDVVGSDSGVGVLWSPDSLPLKAISISSS
jgi:hypothetical protein